MYKLKRVRHTSNFTLGILSLENNHIGYTVERPWLNNQKSVSCIPNGTYELGFLGKKTPLTKRYQERFSWFTHHIEIKNVPSRSNIYIHVGNYPSNVKGCVAIGNTMLKNGVGDSINCFKEFYTTFIKNSCYEIKIF